MAEVRSRGTADRPRVFISSTIGECAGEREAARRAIRGLNFDPVQFEREGAHAEAPRDFYLRKLQDSNVVLAIYRNSYGWIDEAKGMILSGLEDEFREARRLGKDILCYVLKPAPDRDARLQGLVGEMMGGPRVLSFFEEGEDLEPRFRDDLTAWVTDHVNRAQPRSPSIGTADSTLAAIFREGALRVRRNGLLDRLSQAAALARVVWVTGASGAGKTALVAEWSQGRDGAYVNGRGMDARTALLAAAEALGLASGAELAAPLFEDARTMLLDRWRIGAGWPLILDDPADTAAVWEVLGSCLAGSGVGSVVIVTRERPRGVAGEALVVPGFTGEELASLRAIAGVGIAANPGDLPVSLRGDGASTSGHRRYASLDPTSRELLGYLALAPVPLGLVDLRDLIGGSVGTATGLDELLAAMGDLLMETAAGYDFIHESLGRGIERQVVARPQLHGLLIERLSGRLARTGRAWAAFRLLRTERSERVARLADRAVSDAVFTGSTRYLLEALEYLVAHYRSRSEAGRLVSVLMALAETRANQGGAHEAESLLREAREVAVRIGDGEAEQSIDMLQASMDLRRSASATALGRVRVLRIAAATDGRSDREGRLLLDEGIAHLGVNDTEAAAPLFRRAREIFRELDDGHGFDLAMRNLIASLSLSRDRQAEAETLRAELDAEEVETPRRRAWLCNLSVPRLRREGRFGEAEAAAREAIGIGVELGDEYLVAINKIALGNVLRDAEDLEGARAAYGDGARLGRSIGRADIEGRACRLVAAVDNQAAEVGDEAARRELAARAERCATHAAGLLADSFAWVEHASALEERGDARRLQDRHREAMSDYALSIWGYIRGDDAPQGERLLRFFLPYSNDEEDATRLIARAFGGRDDLVGSSASWVEALTVALSRCPGTLAPNVLGRLVRAFMPGWEAGIWFDCLVRCLFAVGTGSGRREDVALGPSLLLAILGFSRHRGFTAAELLTLAGICLGRSDRSVVRHRPGDDLALVVHLGAEQRLLFTVRTDTGRPEAMFVALVIGSFLDAFADELSDILSPDLLAGGAAIDVMVFAQAGETGAVAEFFREGLRDTPVATARFVPKDDEEAPVVVVARSDAIAALEANERRGGELEIMLARFLDEVIFITTGQGLDDAIFSSKVRDLLISILR